jgi:hypothetical protein
VQQGGGLAEEAVRARGVERHLGGLRCMQGLGELGPQAIRPAQLGQQGLARLGDGAGQGLGPPHLPRRHHQARLVGGLERELDMPGGIGVVFGRFDEPEAGAH